MSSSRVMFTPYFVNRIVKKTTENTENNVTVNKLDAVTVAPLCVLLRLLVVFASL
jgi:hypothetical protein